jgi:hypothetical protein
VQALGAYSQGSASPWGVMEQIRIHAYRHVPCVMSDLVRAQMARDAVEVARFYMHIRTLCLHTRVMSDLVLAQMARDAAEEARFYVRAVIDYKDYLTAWGGITHMIWPE